MPNTDPDKEGEPSFRVTDRRRRDSEDPTESQQAPEAQSERTPDPQHPQADAPPTELLPTPDLVRIFIAELQSRALLHLGLIPNPATQLVAKDLPQARLAIDSVAALVEQLSALVDLTEREQLQEMLTNLRIHFVRQSGG